MPASCGPVADQNQAACSPVTGTRRLPDHGAADPLIPAASSCRPAAPDPRPASYTGARGDRWRGMPLRGGGPPAGLAVPGRPRRSDCPARTVGRGLTEWPREVRWTLRRHRLLNDAADKVSCVGGNPPVGGLVGRARRAAFCMVADPAGRQRPVRAGGPAAQRCGPMSCRTCC